MKSLFLNLKISKKLLVAFSLVTILGVINGLFGIYYISSITKNEKELYEVNTSAAIDISGAQRMFFEIELTLKKIIIYSDFTKSSYFTTIDENFIEIDNFISAYEVAVKDEEELQYIRDVKVATGNYKKTVTSIVNSAKADSSNLTLMQMVEISDYLYETTDTAFAKLANFNAAHAKEKINSDSSSSRIAMIVMIGIIVVSALLAVILSRFISKMIADPMTLFAKFAQMLAVGDVQIEFSEADKMLYLRKDEVGALAGSFDEVIKSTIKQGEEARSISDGDLTTWVTVRSDNDIIGNGIKDIASKMHDLAKEITGSTNQVALNANSVSDSSMALSQGATQQASAIEELTASIEEIANQTVVNAKNAETANELAKNVKHGAERGNHYMQEMEKSMENINASSNSIKKIIKVIDDIAFQTNILALNAAVEAARAGQHGRGFAVVAEEVRTLAGRSAQAVKETTELVEGSIKNVELGAGIANGTTAAFSRMSDDIDKVADIIAGIAAAAGEQSSAIEQINQGISQVSQVVQNNAAISEESAAASIELSAQVQKLKDMLGAFKITRNSKNLEDSTCEGYEVEANASAEPEVPLLKNKIPDLGMYELDKVGAAPTKTKPNILLTDDDFGKY